MVIESMNYQVSVEASPLQAMLDLKGDRDVLQSWSALAGLAFPSDRNTAAKQNDIAVYWIGQQHWLVRAPMDQEATLSSMVTAAESADNISAIIVSDATSFYRIHGPDADQLISIASPLDVHSSVFPANGVSYTEAFGLKALVVRCKDGYELGIDRSYFDMIGDCFGKVLADTRD